jgi:hypothetical protein
MKQAFRIVGFLDLSPNMNRPDVGKTVKGDTSDHIMYLQSSDFRVL